MANTIFEIKYLLQRLDSRLEMTEVRVSESEDRLTEISKWRTERKMSLRDPYR